MDTNINIRPESTVGSACQALISTVHQVSTDVTNFVRRCRSSRTDLTPVTRELSELQLVLQLLNDFEEQRDAIPDELQAHLRPIIANCIGLVCKVHDVLRRQEVAGWTVEARDEVGELSKSLGVHRGVIGVVADLISILVARGGVGLLNWSGDEHAQITALLEELQALGSSLVISYSNANLAREHFALQVHLGQIANYTETLARTDLWQDALRALDEADKKAGLDQQTSDMRSSIALPAPLGRGHSADGNAAAAGMRENGLENPLPSGPSDTYDSSRRPSMLFTSKRVPDTKPPAEIDSAGPSGTGFIVMEGFINSAQGDAATTSPAPYHNAVQQTSSPHLHIPGSDLGPSRRSDEIRTSDELSVSHLNKQRLQPIPSAIQDSTSGLQVRIPDEKELAVGDVVSDEALAFAQVPIHVLDRLSVNLVGQVYGSSPTNAEDESSGDKSHYTGRTSRDQDGWDRNEAASISTRDTGGRREGHHESSQIDVMKTPTPATPPITHPNSNSQSESQPQVPSEYHQQQQLLPASHPLSQISSTSASQIASQATDTSIATASPRRSFSSPQSSPHLRPPSKNGSSASASHSGLRLMTSSSTIKTTNTQSYMSQKPLPRAPLVYIPDYPGPFIKKKVVVVGNFSCGKTCLITRMARGQYPRSKADELRITETVQLSVDETPIQLCLWDIRGIDYDPSWLHGAHAALVCFSVNIGSTDSKGKHLGRWVAEVNRNCPGAAILLVGLKADIRFHAKSVEKLARKGKALVTPEQGEQFRENIGATRYLECSARTGEGVQDVLAETARVAMQVGASGARHGRKSSGGGGGGGSGMRPLSRIGKFFGFAMGGE